MFMFDVIYDNNINDIALLWAFQYYKNQLFYWYINVCFYKLNIVAGDENAAKVIADLQQKLAAKQGMINDYK